MIDKTRDVVSSFAGKLINFKYNGSRNQVVLFEGVISECYKQVFIINTDNGRRSFSYSDVLIGTLEINV